MLPNLKTLSDGRYRVKMEIPLSRNIQNQIIPFIGKAGHMYCYGPGRIGVSIDIKGPRRKALLALPGARIEQDGDDGMNISLPTDTFDSVAAIMKPYRIPNLSPEERQRRRDRISFIR